MHCLPQVNNLRRSRVYNRVSAVRDEEVPVDWRGTVKLSPPPRPARKAQLQRRKSMSGLSEYFPGEILPPFVARDSLTNSCFIALFIAARHTSVLVRAIATTPPACTPPMFLGPSTVAHACTRTLVWAAVIDGFHPYEISGSSVRIYCEQFDRLYLVLFMINPQWYSTRYSRDS